MGGGGDAMNTFVLNLVLAFSFALMFGEFRPVTLIVGFVIGFILLIPISRATNGRTYGGSLWRLLRFSLYFVRILIAANLSVAREVITPGFSLTPRLVRLDVTGLSDLQVTILSNAITLTPGTLTVDVGEPNASGHRFLYVHCMFGADREKAVAELVELRDRLIKEVFV